MPLKITHQAVVELLRASGEAGHFLEQGRPNSRAKRIAIRLKKAHDALMDELRGLTKCEAD